MAKFKRFDPRNKKANSHKQRVKFALNEKRIKKVKTDETELYQMAG